jgi:hypothetical protein
MDAKVGSRIPVSARWFDADGEATSAGARAVFYVEDAGGSGRRFLQANSVGAALAATEVEFPLTPVAGQGHVLVGGWVAPTAAKGLEVVCEKRPPPGVEAIPLSESWRVTASDEDDLAETIGKTDDAPGSSSTGSVDGKLNRILNGIGSGAPYAGFKFGPE